ncbi:uncharacterized protein [Hyperolius riggenbachi]|uniref:uncharacterized protein n=1 Tax=Hyperolius riggenbachi TaxID=752182 RepID=UPI0035A36DB8
MWADTFQAEATASFNPSKVRRNFWTTKLKTWAKQAIHSEVHFATDSVIHRPADILHNVLVKGRDSIPGKIMAAGDPPLWSNTVHQSAEGTTVHKLRVGLSQIKCLTDEVRSLTVVKQPKFLQGEVGQSVTIICQLEPEQKTFSANWTVGCKNESLADHQHYRNRVSLSWDHLNVTITSLTEEDSGIYHCNIRNVKTAKRPGTMLYVTPLSTAKEAPSAGHNWNMGKLVIMETLRISCLIILIILLTVTIMMSC